MVKLHWLLIGSLVATGVWAAPAQAGKRLTFWEFDDQQRQLKFQTKDPVQPRAQLVSNPTRVVIDLPKTTLIDPEQSQMVGGFVKEVRVAQFDEETTRLVVELQEGYTLDPDKIEIRGETPTKWSLQLPSPEPKGKQETTQLTQNQQFKEITDNPNFRVTSSGFLLQLEQSPSKDIKVKRSENQKEIRVQLPGATFASELPSVLPIANYGISYAEFRQGGANSPAEVHFHVNENSPDWRAIVTGNQQMLVLMPKGGMQALKGIPTPPLPSSLAEVSSSSQGSQQQQARATVEAIDLVDNQLLVRANRRLKGTGNWNQKSGVYELEIPNAKLAEPVDGPELTRDSPVSQIRLVQSDEDTVLVQVQSAPRVKISEQVNQPSATSLALHLKQSGRSSRQSRQSRNLNVPQAQQRLSRRSKQEEPLIVIAPGHGGKDPGAIGRRNLQEKDVVLSISLAVRDILQQHGVSVKSLRQGDRFISLSGRAQMANRMDADFFVSIHANAINMDRPDVNGAETYYYSSGSGYGLARSIQRNIARQTNMRDRGVKEGNLYVLRNTSMPAALVETGFLTGREDAPRLADPDFRQQMAQAIADGILEYINHN